MIYHPFVRSFVVNGDFLKCNKVVVTRSPFQNLDLSFSREGMKRKTKTTENQLGE